MTASAAGNLDACVFRHPALSLLETLVVVAIIGVLAALTIPAIQKARESAARTECENTLKQLGLAIHGFIAAQGALPPCRMQGPSGGLSKKVHHSWAPYLLPYIEQDALYGLPQKFCNTTPEIQTL